MGQDAVLHHREDSVNNRWLILGSGESGKSTIFSHLCHPVENPNHFDVYFSLLRQLCVNWLDDDSKLQMRNQYNEHEMIDVLLDETFFKTYNDLDEKSCGAMLKQIWSNYLSKAYDRYRLEIQYCENMDTLSNLVPNFGANTQHIVRLLSMKSTSVSECVFDYMCKSFKITDMGGVRNERKKWYSYLIDSKRALFVVSLVGFLQTTIEDDLINRLENDLELFEELCPFFQRKQYHVTLIFTKPDILLKVLNDRSLQSPGPIEAKVRSELQRLKSHNQIEVFISNIVTRFESIYRQYFDSASFMYHIVNTTSDEEMGVLIRCLFGSNNSISHLSYCLYERMCTFTQDKLLMFARQKVGNFADIELVT